MTRFHFASMSLIATLIASAGLVGCATSHQDDASWSPAQKQKVERLASQSVATFRTQDPSLDKFFNTADAYAIFPQITAGAAGLGGAYGEGVVYQDGKVIGYATLSQGTIGLQLGGKSYSEIIFFETPLALTKFQNGELEFSADAAAVAASNGAAATANYSKGVAVFVTSQSGLMASAAIGGQQFEYWPKTD